MILGGVNLEKPIKHIVSLSGGKDSTAMLLRMLEEGWPVDIILFCDTGMEFDAMYRHIEKLERYTGRSIVQLKSPQSFEYHFIITHPNAPTPSWSSIVASAGRDLATAGVPQC